MAGLSYLNITDWRYENVGLAQLLSISGTTLNDLPLDKSLTSTAFYQTTRAKCFDLPATPQIWAKFDVYFDGSNRWRAYNQGSAGYSGVCSYSGNTKLGMWHNGTRVQDFNDVCKTNQLQTVLLHIVSGTNGLIEAWIDGTKLYTYNGNVNNGDDFADFYLQSDGAGTFFSNVIISNVQIGLNENIPADSLTIKPELYISWLPIGKISLKPEIYASLLPSGNLPQKISVDLLRAIANTEKNTADIKRQVGATQKKSTDLLRTVTKVEKIIGDTSRQIANGSIALTKAYAALLRKITTTEQSTADTVRIIEAKEKVSANTVRSIAQRNSTTADTLLRIGTKEKLSVDVLLRLRHFARGNTERKIIKRQKIKANTIIRVPHLLNYYLQRRNAIRMRKTRDEESKPSVVNTFKDYGVTQVIVTLNEKTLSDTFEVTFVNSAEKTAPNIDETIRFKLLTYSFEFVVEERQITEETTIIKGQYNKNNILYSKYKIPDLKKQKVAKGTGVFASDDSIRSDMVNGNPVKVQGTARIEQTDSKRKKMTGVIIIEGDEEIGGSNVFDGEVQFYTKKYDGEIFLSDTGEVEAQSSKNSYVVNFSGSGELSQEKDIETGLRILSGAVSIDGGEASIKCVSFAAQIKSGFSTADLLANIAKKMGLKLKAHFDDFYPVTLEGVKTMTYQEILSHLFGWSSQVPTIQVNVFIRESTLYVIQRGKEETNFDLANYTTTKLTSTEQKIRKDIYTDDELIDTGDDDDDDDDDDVPFSGLISWSDNGAHISCQYNEGLLIKEEVSSNHTNHKSKESINYSSQSTTEYKYMSNGSTIIKEIIHENSTSEENLIQTSQGVFIRNEDNSFTNVDNSSVVDDNVRESLQPYDIKSLDDLTQYYITSKVHKETIEETSSNGKYWKYTEKTDTTEYVYSRSDKVLYLQQETTKSEKKEKQKNNKQNITESRQDIYHFPLGNGFYAQAIVRDGIFQSGNISTGKPGSAISPYTVKQTQSDLKTLGASNVIRASAHEPNSAVVGQLTTLFTYGAPTGETISLEETIPEPETKDKKIVKLGSAFEILTHSDDDSKALYEKCLQTIIDFSNAIETTISCDIVSEIRDGVPGIDYIIDFTDTINGGYLVTNKITFTPRKLIQSLTFRKWKAVVE